MLTWEINALIVLGFCSEVHGFSFTVHFQSAKVKKRFSELQDLCTIELFENVLRFAKLVV